MSASTLLIIISKLTPTTPHPPTTHPYHCNYLLLTHHLLTTEKLINWLYKLVEYLLSYVMSII